MTPSYDRRYLEYVHLFNTRQYWHAHEALENLWLEQRTNPDRVFYKGMIQLAAALYHVEKGNFRGAWSLFESASRYISEYPPVHLGIHRKALLESMKEFIAGSEKEGLKTWAERPIIRIE